MPLPDTTIAIVGGGEFTAEVLQRTSVELADHENIHARIRIVADPDQTSPAMVKARQLGLETLSDYRRLYDPCYNVGLIIILDPEPETLYSILADKPQTIRVMSRQTFDLFWHSITIEAEKHRRRTLEIEAILDGIQDFIVVIKPDMTITEVNKEFLERMGYSREEVIGRKCFEVYQRMNRQCRCNDENRICPLQDVIALREARQRVFPRVNSQGKVVYVELELHPIWERDGSLSRIIEISRDVSNSDRLDEVINKRLEKMVEERTRELKKRQAELLHQDKMASLGKLSASVVHEINNPLAGILNLTLLMKRIMDEEGSNREAMNDFSRYLAMMESETRRISRITSNLLSFSRESKVEMGRVSINQLLEDVLFLNANFLKVNAVRLSRELDQDMPEIIGDGEQLKQVFMNLISNAVEAMEPKGGGELTVRTERQGSFVQINLSDTGVGIAEGDTSRLFDPFFTTKARGKGIGLGLSVAFGIVQQHCGSIDIESQQGYGTAIRLQLPLNQPSEQYH